MTIRMLLLASCLCVAPLHANTISEPLLPAKSETENPTQLARNLVNHSGILDAIRQIPLALKGAAVMGLRRSGASDDAIRSLQTRITATFDASELERLLEEHVLTLMSPGDMQAVTAWLTSPVGLKVVAAEVAAGTVEGNAAMERDINALLQQYKGSPREQLFNDYDRAIHATETLVEGTLSMQVALMTAVMGASDPANVPPVDDLKQELESRRMAMKMMMTQEAYASYLYMYRDLSLEEINAYIDFARSEAGARYVQVLIDGVWEVMAQRSERLSHVATETSTPGA